MRMLPTGWCRDRPRVAGPAQPVELGGWTVSELLTRLKHPGPSWGGGTAGAIAAAQGCALIVKIAGVARIPIPEAVSLGPDLLVGLAEEDQQAYTAMIRARRDPVLYAQKLRESGTSSLKIAQLCEQGIQTAADLMATVKPVLRADLLAAFHLLYAGCQSALINIETNFNETDTYGQADRELLVWWKRRLRALAREWAAFGESPAGDD